MANMEYNTGKSTLSSPNAYALNQYQMWAETTAVFPEENRTKYLVFGLLAEIGEICGVYAKYYRGDFDQARLRERLVGELGDVFWFLAMLFNTARPKISFGQMYEILFLLCRRFGVNIQDVIETNTQKLEMRKQNNTLKGDGEVR